MQDPISRPLGRRGFFKLSAASAGALVIAACGDDDEGGDAAQTQPQTQTQPQEGGVTIDFSEPTAIANFALALELLEAAFYTQVTDNPFDGITDRERRVFDDLREHETAHVDFLTAVLGDQAVSGLEVDFSAVDFADRASVFQTAATFEPLGVSAYNGAAPFIDASTDLGLTLLQAAGEIVSVEARHASVIIALQEELNDGSYAPDAFDPVLVPSEVLPEVQPFLKTSITATNLPQGA